MTLKYKAVRYSVTTQRTAGVPALYPDTPYAQYLFSHWVANVCKVDHIRLVCGFQTSTNQFICKRKKIIGRPFVRYLNRQIS